MHDMGEIRTIYIIYAYSIYTYSIYTHSIHSIQYIYIIMG